VPLNEKSCGDVEVGIYKCLRKHKSVIQKVGSYSVENKILRIFHR